MVKEFCSIASLRKEIENILNSFETDYNLINSMRTAVINRDRGEIIRVAKASQETYHSLYPLLLFAYSVDITRQYYPNDTVLKATLSDISIWCDNYKRDNGVIGFGNINWISKHITGSLMRLGRLQAEVTTSEYSGTDEEIISLHIPQGDSFAPGKIEESLHLIKEQFPQFDKAYCFSWLLDPALKSVLDDKSNIIQFQNRFTLFEIPSDNGKQTFERVFFTGATKEDVLNFVPQTSLQKSIKAAVEKGINFSHYGGYVTL